MASVAASAVHLRATALPSTGAKTQRRPAPSSVRPAPRAFHGEWTVCTRDEDGNLRCGAGITPGLYDVSTARFPAGSRHSWVPSPDRRDEVICMENMEGHLVCDTTNSHFFARTEDWEFVPKFEVHSRLEEEEQRLQQKRASSSSS